MNISSVFQSGRLTVFLSGELDHHEARSVLRSIGELLEEYLPRDCILELSDLRFMDSSGIALIVQLCRRMRDLGGRAWIENPNGQPLRVIDASGIERLIHVSVGR